MNPYENVLKLSESKETPAQKRILSAMLQMLEEQDSDQIQVSALCDRAQTSRSTFYLYYKHIEDVLEDLANGPVRELIGLVHCQNMSNRDFVLSIWDSLSSYQETIRIVVIRHRNAVFTERLTLGLHYLLWERLFCGCINPPAEAELVISMTSTSLFQAFCSDLESKDTAASGSKLSGSKEKTTNSAVSGCETVTGMLDMIESRISKTSVRCRVRKV